MPAVDISSWMLQLLDHLRLSGQRQLVAFQGPVDWCDSQLAELKSLDPQILVFSNRHPGVNSISLRHADACLGSEARLVALDLFEGFNVDVFCIVAGLVKAGGVLLLLSPRLADWSAIHDRYALWQDQASSNQPLLVDYFFSQLQQDKQIGIFISPQSERLSIPSQPSLQATEFVANRTAEQAQVLRQLGIWLHNGREAVALISADRGRGKSTCLGQLVESVFSDRQIKILATAYSRKIAAQFLQLAADVEFIAPDQLIKNCPAADLLIIDEAAMLPQSMLRQLCRLYPRLLMATTTGGYEGTGQGFLHRFVAGFAAQTLLHLHLHKPVRWCQGDQLEAWVNRSLMLTQPAAAQTLTGAQDQPCDLLFIDAPGKAEHLPVLRQVYTLLATAHYRTRPSDLRMLMENPDLQLLVASIGDDVIGAALLNREGGFDASLSREIFLGRRRPRGHLLAQMLSAQAGVADFASFRGLRIQRIAVAQSHRRRRIGSRLVERAFEYARDNKFDYLGASFALDPETAAFWQRTGLELVHVSFAQGKSSGNHSIAVIKAISSQLLPPIEQLQQRIQRQLATWMTQFLQTMEAVHVVALLRYCGYQADINDLEYQEITAFARGQKGFELCFASLQKFVMQRIGECRGDIDDILIEKAVQNRNWENLERETGSQGRAQLQQRLRGLVDVLMNKA